MKKFLLIFIFSASSQILFSAQDLEVKYLRNYDGDTFYVEIPDLKRYDRRKKLAIFWEDISVRIAGIDTPEIRGSKCAKEKKLALKAKKELNNALQSARHIKLKNVQKGKYFRLLADVLVDGESVSKILMKKKLAIAYDGGTKTNPWCN